MPGTKYSSGRKPVGERAKHKLPLSGNTGLLDKLVLSSIRQKTLQKLVLLYELFLTGRPEYKWSKILRERAGGYNRRHITESLKPEDVMEVLGCSKRTAIDYIETLMFIVPW